jgi:hypothetical protein
VAHVLRNTPCGSDRGSISSEKSRGGGGCARRRTSITAIVIDETIEPSPYAMNSSFMIRVSQCEPREESPSWFSPISGSASREPQPK